MIISGRTSLLALLDREQARQQLSDAALCRAAGVGSNTMGNLRGGLTKNTNMATALALVNALGLDLLAVPAVKP